MSNKKILIPVVTLSLMATSALTPIVYAEEIDSEELITAEEVISNNQEFDYSGDGTLTYEDNIIYISGDIILNLNNQELSSSIELDSNSSLTLNITNNSGFSGELIQEDTSSVSVILDDTSKLVLCGDTKLSSLENSIEDNSNIDFGDYKLYVNDEEIISITEEKLDEEIIDDAEVVNSDNSNTVEVVQESEEVENTNTSSNTKLSTKTSVKKRNRKSTNISTTKSTNKSKNKKTINKQSNSNDNSNKKRMKSKESTNEKEVKEKGQKNNENSNNTVNSKTLQTTSNANFLTSIWNKIKDFLKNLFN